ncbi:MAG TPA: glycoside hydrolase family 31 protein [Intrasporangium sp.]|uniref:glycoside hydrolase family 31 protein n=1 Tax=Intrasporangium sp. TaxID=1925024 RepID=UPI002D78C258|nr:glycoside hydrolase family 31 protein [Intrasporangium sp.]HET7397858.1 glycoside hydrolase family 31 protein [Intrasporangium sp.]
MLETDHFIRFERVGTVTRTERGLLAEVHTEQLRIDVVRDDVVRIAMSRGGVFDERPTYAVCVDPFAGPVPDLRVERDADRVRLFTDALVVSLWLDPFRIDVHRADGSPVIETAADDDGRYWAYATLNDAFTVRRRCGGADAVYGLGEKGGRHNRKGRDFTMWNTDVLSPVESAEFTAGREPGDPRGDRTSTEFDPYYVTVPFFYHQRYDGGQMAGSFVDNSYRAYYDFTAAEEYRIAFSGGQYVEYVFAGPSMPGILTAYTDLTGRAALPPIWALGYHQCRWHRYTQDDIEAIARRHRDDDFPCDALWLDIEYMDGYRVFTWDTEAFPDAPGMLDRLAQQGFRVITIIDPGVKHEPGYWVFDQGRERDLFCRTEGGDTYVGQVWPGDTAFPDFATQEARDWWGELNAAHVESGLAGIWNDMNEPATGTIPSAPMRFDHGRASHDRFHNQYALLMAMGTHDGLLRAMPERRTFILSRAGFAGVQRYAANWMGDNQSRWDHLWVSMTMACGFGVSGQPFVGADIGGFQGNASAELFLRWMQYGALTPFCRNHSEIGNIEQYAWAFGDAVHGHAREAVRLRYRLLPYLYAAFVRASETGEPVQRPLVFDHQDDAAVRDIDDEYLFGRDLLVAPVDAPGMTARQVYLPGVDWYDWHSREPVRGRQHVIVATPMDRIPIFVRAGAVVPMWPEAPASTAGYHPEVVELHLFVPTADGTMESLLVEDDGVTFAAARGAWLRTTFAVRRTGRELTVEALVEGDGYPESRRQAFRLVVHGADPATVLVDGDTVERADGAFLLANTGTGFRLTLQV